MSADCGSEGRGFEPRRSPSLLQVKRSLQRALIEDYGSSRAAVDHPKASSLALACYKCVQGTAGSVGESSSVDPLTDVPEFRQVRHRRKSFARVPRRGVLGS